MIRIDANMKSRFILSPFDEFISTTLSDSLRTAGRRHAAKANICERRDVQPLTGNRLEGAEIPAGHGPAVRPTEPRRGGFPRRLAVRGAACLRPSPHGKWQVLGRYPGKSSLFGSGSQKL